METGFVTSWGSSPKGISYDPLEDKHNRYFFKLPAIQEHLKKWKKKAKREPGWADNTALIHSIEHKMIAPQKTRSPESIKVYVDDFIKDLNSRFRGSGSARDGIFVREVNHKLRRSEDKPFETSSHVGRLIHQKRTKTDAGQSVDHAKFVDYLKRKREEIYKETEEID